MQMSALWLCLRLCQFKISWDTLAFRLPLTYKRLIVWDIYRPSYVIGKRKQQGSSNFAPRQTSPRGIFCDDQSAFSIPLGINEKKAPRNTSSPDKHDCSDNLTSYIAFSCLVKEWYFYKIWSILPTDRSDRNCFFYSRNFFCLIFIKLTYQSIKWPQNCYRIRNLVRKAARVFVLISTLFWQLWLKAWIHPIWIVFVLGCS